MSRNYQSVFFTPVGGQIPAASSLCSPLPANPYGSVSGSKIFTFPPTDFALSRARRPPLFAPRSPRTLMPPFRGAKSSHSRRRISPLRAPGGLLSLLPTPREPLCLRSGEQNLHIHAAGFRPLKRPAADSLCSPFPASPYTFVPGSKIFTFPPALLGLSRARRPTLFAPRSPLTLAPPFRGAKSSHSRRLFSTVHVPGGLPSLLPAPREPLCLRSWEQNLHIPAAGFRPSERPAAPSLCSPTPANPYTFVPGSKIFTFRRRRVPRHAGGASPHAYEKAPGSAIAARCFFLSSLSIIPIPLLPPAQS